MKMTSRNIIKSLSSGELIKAKEMTEYLLYSKVSDQLAERYPELSPELFEAKLDPVDKGGLKGKHKDREDKDIDNDGDVDKSDKYLHKRRKAVSKATKRRNGGALATNEDHPEITHKGSCKQAHPDMSHEEWEDDQEVEEGFKSAVKKVAKAAGEVGKYAGRMATGREPTPIEREREAKRKDQKKKELARKREALGKERARVEKESIEYDHTLQPKVAEIFSKKELEYFASLHNEQADDQLSFGMRSTDFASKSPEQKSQIRQKYYSDKEKQERDKEKDRKETERSREARKRELGAAR